MTMTKISTDLLEKTAQGIALDIFLSDYPQELSYDQLLTMMTEEPDWESHITVWLPFEYYDGHWMAKTINETKMSIVRRFFHA
jgi:hypothetical protein